VRELARLNAKGRVDGVARLGRHEDLLLPDASCPALKRCQYQPMTFSYGGSLRGVAGWRLTLVASSMNANATSMPARSSAVVRHQTPHANDANTTKRQARKRRAHRRAECQYTSDAMSPRMSAAQSPVTSASSREARPGARSGQGREEETGRGRRSRATRRGELPREREREAVEADEADARIVRLRSTASAV